MILYIDRLVWMRGRNVRATELLTFDGKRCCFGILAQACGIEDEKILGKPVPADVDDGRWPEWINGVDRPNIVTQLLHANDGDAYEFPSPVSREVALSRWFSKAGVHVVFFN